MLNISSVLNVEPISISLVVLTNGRGAFRFGHRHTLTGADLIVWLKVESTQELSVTFHANRETR